MARRTPPRALSDADLDAIAREMKAAQDAALPLEPFSARYPGFGLEAAYAVAHRIHEMRMAEGARPVGRKIGFTNAAMWAIHGVREPVWAPVYDTTVELLAGTAATCALGGLLEPRIEPEIVLHFRSAPALGGGPEGVLESIDWVAHGFEVVQSHFPEWRFAAPDTVVDRGLHARLFVGPRVPVEEIAIAPARALAAFTLEISRDGKPVERGRGADVLGSPLAAIVHLVALLARQPFAKALAAGELVTTGTVTTAHPVQPGETWRSALRGISLPGLAIAFVA